MATAPGFENDIFISYSHIDDEVAISGDQGWVSSFHRALERRVSALSGQKIRIWRDEELFLPDSHPGERTLEALRRSALFIAIVSPSYIQSVWGSRELEEFVSLKGPSDRMIKVIKTPVSYEGQPEVLRNLLGYPFYEEDKSGRVREFGFEGDTREAYFNALDSLAYDIVNRLNALRGDSPAQEQTRGSSSFEFIDPPKEIQKSKTKKRKREEAPTPAAESDDTGAAPSAPSPAPPSQVLDLDLAANEPESARLVSAHLHSDMWTLDDRLGYSLYAKAIGEFIHHKSTSPPLTIGIYAPWGQGKTTLMRLIELKLKELANKKSVEKKGADAQSVSPTALTTVKQLINWLDKPEVPELKKLSYPTVWFNAWKYQNSDQVWAGLAHCIIDDLVSQIESPLEREKFWLLLQAKRLDFNKIREDIHVSVVQHFLTPSLIFVGIVTILIALGVLSVLSGFIASWFIGGGIAIVGPLLASLFRWAWEKRKVLNKPLEGDLAKYVNKPDYESKRGFFSEVEDDIRRVFALLVQPEEPAVVFVDDLDRCSPGKIAEVIEAINLFLSGDFPN
nr:TIR domain-containing protein [Rhodothermaceae bacterium]